jgi:hypothetical protein
MSPFGKITIRWWNDFDWGFLFDFEYPLNSDGIVERWWNVPQGSRLAFYEKGSPSPFAVVHVPQLAPFPGQDIPQFFPIKPEV